MKMKFSKMGLLLTASSLLALTGITFAAAQATRTFSDAKSFRHLHGIVTALDISDTQKKELHDILGSHLPVLEPMVRDWIDARRNLRDLIRQDTLDEAAIRAQSQKVASIETELAVKKAFLIQDAKRVLTSEQMHQVDMFFAALDARVDSMLDRIVNVISEK